MSKGKRKPKSAPEPDPNDHELRELVIFVQENVGFRLGVATYDNPRTRGTYLDRLAEAVADAPVHLTRLDLSATPDEKLLLTRLKEHLRDHPALFRLTDRNLLRVARLGREALREAVEHPAALHGVGFAPRLVEEIIEEVEGQPGDLPLLQYTLDALWRKEDISGRLLRLATYRALGGVRGALRDRFESLYASEDDAGKKVFRAVTYALSAAHRSFRRLPATGPQLSTQGFERGLVANHEHRLSRRPQ